ncbi:MAG: hypothetical protein HY556_09920 [Euryarchaeota archaeon]|nr:hypothetical protein [Euryarchaeota archaeon]
MILLLAASTGCTTTDTDGDWRLVLTKLEKAPNHVINVTQSDLDENAVLNRMFQKIEAGAAGAREDYPREDIGKLIRSFQSRDPGPWWTTNGLVYLTYKGDYFQLMSSHVVS